MKHYGGRDLAAAFRTVRANTVKIAEEIPEDKYNFQAAPDTRTVAQLLAHIAGGPAFALHVHGNPTVNLATINFPEVMQKLRAEEEKPRTKSELIALLTAEGERFASFLESLSDDFLAEPVAMPAGAQPTSKTRFELLLSPKEHEMHHRAQLMLIERLLGIVPHLTRQFHERMAQATARGAAR